MLTAASDTVINPDDLKRAEQDELDARASSFALKSPIYTLGTPVNSTGVKNFQASAHDYDALPPFESAAAELRGRIEGENRGRIEATLPDLRLGPDGSLAVGGSNLRVTPNALEQLVSRAGTFPGGAFDYLSDCPPTLRAVNCNHFFPQAVRKGKPVPVVLRTRDGVAGKREAFAALAPIYRPYDIDQVLTAMTEKLGVVGASLGTSKKKGSGARGELTYDGQRAVIKAYYHSPIKPKHAVAGEIFKAALIADTADDGSRALHFKVALWRNLCRNLIILDVAEQHAWTAHVRKDMTGWVDEQLTACVEKLSSFANKWSDARAEKIMEGIYGDGEPKAIFTQLVKSNLVRVPGVKSDELVDRLVSAWQLEPGYTKADVVNAVTRAAHSQTWGNPWDATSLEEQGGALLYQNVTWRPYQPEEANA